LLVVLLVAAPAIARPRVAVAPLDGDDDQKVSAIVADAAGEHAKVTGPGRVAKALDKLSISSLNSKGLKKLRSNLEVDVVIHGAVSNKHLELTLSGKGKQKATLELDYKSTKALRKELAAKLGKKLDDVSGDAADDDDDDDDRKAEEARKAKEEEERKKREDEEREAARKKREDDEREAARKKREDDDDRRRKKKHGDDDDDRHGKKRVASDDDDDRSVRKRSDDDDERPRKRKHHRGDDDDDLDEPPRNPITQAALWLDAGGAFARRTLTYDATGTMQPPGVGTAAAAASIEGELYPGAFKSLRGGGAAIGFFGDYSYTFGLGIAVPGANTTAPIQDGHYSVGARYRVVFGSSSIAFGAAYWRRWYIADRKGLTMPTQLDMPDVDYTAVAPGVVARFAAAPKVGVVLEADVPLMLDAGPIAKSAGYGAADIIAFDVLAGLQIALAPHAALLLRGDFSQQGFSFAGKPGSMAATRGVTAATDRSMGLTATIGILY
jgi:hypothetical protein